MTRPLYTAAGKANRWAEPMQKYLTQKEVDELPEGTEVIITWSGGNGPHKYITGKYDGESYTTFVASDEKRHLGDRIDFVGAEKPFTMVSLPNTAST